MNTVYEQEALNAVKILKAFHLAEYKYSGMNRESLCRTWVASEGQSYFLFSTDGTVLVKKYIDAQFWWKLAYGLKIEFGFVIPEQICEGAFFLSKKVRQHLHMSLFETKEKFTDVIPNLSNLLLDRFDCPPEERPLFTYAMIARANKIISTCGEKKLEFRVWWNGKLGPAKVDCDSLLLYIMPCRDLQPQSEN